jgi:predicted alpha/beta hydrolase
MGASATLPLAGEPARMSHWGLLDMPAVLEWLERRFRGQPLVTLGHSVGGQLIGCMYNQAAARAHVMVATSRAAESAPRARREPGRSRPAR